MLSIAVGMAALPVSPCLYSACLSCHHLSLAGCNVWSLTFSSTDIQGLFFFIDVLNQDSSLTCFFTSSSINELSI